MNYLVPADDGSEFEHGEEPEVGERRVVAETAPHGLETRAPEFVPGAYGGGFAAGGYGGFGLANGAPADEDAYPEGGMGGIIEASLDSLVGGDA